MAWIESHQSIAGHPKTKRAARILGVSIPAMVGHLHLLWHWALDYAQDGDVSDYDAFDIAEAAQWDGDEQAFVDALIDAGPGGSPGFLERDGRFGPPDDESTGELVIHDWWAYAGKLVAKRQTDAERKRKARRREQTGTSTDVRSDVQQTSTGRPADVAGTQPTQPTQPTLTNQPEPTTAQKAPPQDQPDNLETPWAVLVALCEELGKSPDDISPSFKKQQLGIAKQILEDGFNAERVRRCIRYLKSQEWRSGPIDLRTVKSEIGRWELAGEPEREVSKAGVKQQRNGIDYSEFDEFNWNMDELERRNATRNF